MHFSVLLLFFFPFFISPCQNFSPFWLYPSTMKAYIDHLLFSFFFQLYSHIINNFWLLLRLCVPEVEHDERHFFWKKKNKTTICCLNSLCRALLESTILWISETMKNYFHDLFLIEKWCALLIFGYHKLFMIFKVGILNITVHFEKWTLTLNFF